MCLAAKQHIRMISEGSRDTENCIWQLKFQLCHHRNKLHLHKLHKIINKTVNSKIFHSITVLQYFYKVNTVFVRIRDFQTFQKHGKILQTPNILTVFCVFIKCHNVLKFSFFFFLLFSLSFFLSLCDTFILVSSVYM